MRACERPLCLEGLMFNVKQLELDRAVAAIGFQVDWFCKAGRPNQSGHAAGPKRASCAIISGGCFCNRLFL